MLKLTLLYIEKSNNNINIIKITQKLDKKIR